MRRCFLPVALLAILTLMLCLPTLAHDPQLSGVRVIVGDGATLVSVMTHRSQLAAAGAPGKSADRAALDAAAVDQAIRRRLMVRLDGAPFVPTAASLMRDDANDLLVWQSHYPREAKIVEVASRLYPENPSSRFVVSVVRGGVTVEETLLDAAHPALVAGKAKSSIVTAAVRYIHEGLRHIFGGPDHIAFVVGLLLFGGTLKHLLKTVTAFTLAHSITLSLAAAGVWSPSPRFVEPLIALSIVCIAWENLRPRPRRTERDLRPLLAFGFGLIHGFGFAGALSQVGLPRDALWAALASFNIGVEIGQATIILTLTPLLARLANRRPVWHQRTIVLGSVAIGLAGLYWFATRLLL